MAAMAVLPRWRAFAGVVGGDEANAREDSRSMTVDNVDVFGTTG
jgi:hypothetical protein